MSGGLSIEPGALGLVRVEDLDGRVVTLSAEQVSRLVERVERSSDPTVCVSGVEFDESDAREVYQASVRSLRAAGSRCRSCAARKWSE